MPPYRPLEERLWEKVRIGGPNDCWEWMAGCQGDGYGQIGIGKSVKLVHRIVYELSNGNIDPKLCVMHKCDNRRCCNPVHLMQGTRAENNQDRHHKGRTKPPPGMKGTTNPRNKLTEQQVIEIFFARGTLQSIADAYGIKMGTVHDIKKGRIWGWLTQEATHRAGQNFK